MLVNLDAQCFTAEIHEVIRLACMAYERLALRGIPAHVIENALQDDTAPDVVEAIEADRLQSHQEVVGRRDEVAVIADVHRTKRGRHSRWDDFMSAA